jgi:acyl carrier protein
MEKNEILNIIKKHIVRIVDTKEEIDPERSMKDYGASSLDIVEIVSSAMRELKLKVPRMELNNINNISGLVDVFYKHANKPKE